MGNNTSKVELEIISSSVPNYGIYIGGIAGQTGYRTEDCIISGTKLELNGRNVDSATNVYMGSLIGKRDDASWEMHKTFEPDEYGIFNSSYKDVVLENNLKETINVTVDAYK